MRHGAWQETGSGSVLTAGGALGVAALVIAYADRHQIERAAGEAVAVAAVAVAVVIVAAVAAVPFIVRALVRRRRREAAALDATRERLAVEAEERRERREHAALEAQRYALAPAPVVHVHNYLSPEMAAVLLNGRQPAPVVIPAITEEADR